MPPKALCSLFQVYACICICNMHAMCSVGVNWSIVACLASCLSFVSSFQFLIPAATSLNGRHCHGIADSILATLLISAFTDLL